MGLKLFSTAKWNQSGVPGRRGYFDLFIEVRKPPLKSMWSGLIYKEGMGFPKVGTGSQSYLFFPEDFVIQAKADCYFTNGTEKVQFVVRFIFNLEEYARFDSSVGMFVALTELGKPDAELWNNQSDILERSRASVDALCRHNYQLGAPFTVGRKGEVDWEAW